MRLLSISFALLLAACSSSVASEPVDRDTEKAEKVAAYFAHEHGIKYETVQCYQGMVLPGMTEHIWHCFYSAKDKGVGDVVCLLSKLNCIKG